MTDERTSDTALVLLAKAPVPGQVKTRFCPPCTPDEAAEFARAFLMDTSEVLDAFPALDRWCSYFGPSTELESLLAARLLLQRGEGLGERIANACDDLFAEGYKNIVVLCADCPTVDIAYMSRTVDALAKHDLVFGPARDGGCLLVALSTPAQYLFRTVEMSTDHVHVDMQAIADTRGLSYANLDSRYDLDYMSDLQHALDGGELNHAQNTQTLFAMSRFANRVITDDELATPLKPLDKAIEVVVREVDTLPPTVMSVAQCDGYVLAENVKATIDVPPFNNSSMDGYAVAHADVSDDGIMASAVKVMTGQPLPFDCDTVVPWEHTTTAGSTMRCDPLPKLGQFVRSQGEDVSADHQIISSGTTLTPVHLGLLATSGVSEVSVIPKPRVAVLVTGNELQQPGTQLNAGQIYDANTSMLPALLAQAGAEITDVGYCGDDADEIARWFKEHDDADAIITTGGASVGQHDWVRTVLGDLGQVSVWRVAVKPGKPFGFGHIGDTPVFVLPGNPASVLACSHAFVIPALRKLQGLGPVASTAMQLEADVAAPDDRVFLCPVTINDSFVTPARAANSSVISNHLLADGYAYIPSGGAKAGTTVQVERVI